MKKLLYILSISILIIACSDENTIEDDTTNSEDVINNPTDENEGDDTNDGNNDNNDNTNDNIVDTEGVSVDKTDYTLVFNESFDSDLSKWKEWNGGAFNNEIQLYQSEQLNIHEGILTINTKRQNISGNENPWSTNQKNFEYVSGRIESKEFYGPSSQPGENTYIIATRMQLPTGHGMWPAFWLYADPWPTLGELDILEARGGVGKDFQFNMFYGTENGKPIGQNSKRVYKGNVDLRNDYHVYELIWQENKIQIALDGQIVITVDSSRNNLEDIFGNKLSIVLNTAVGGVFFSDKNSANYADQAEMKVDWIRVYKK